MDRYLREETNLDGDDESKQMILQASISTRKNGQCIILLLWTFSKKIEKKILTKRGRILFCNHAKIL
uniref:Uncharacterized protein n=1 Tax=Solanum lycopersicum TaxID=4081 RepID=A0A3Q7HM32_SOLLC